MNNGDTKMNEETPMIRNSTAEFLIFTRQAGEDGIEVRYQDETIWLTQKLIAKLFGVDVRTVSEHLKNIFASKELRESSVLRKFRIAAADGKNYNTQFYNLDAIISVGYRVKAIKKFALNNSRLKRPSVSDGADGFLERIMALYLDYAEAKARRHEPVTMEQWAEKFDAFLQFDEHELLMNPRKVEAEVAKRLAEDCDERFAAPGHATH